MCSELFDHIITTAMDTQDAHGLYSCTDAPNSVICHILRHLQENDNNILTLLSCESSEFFLRYFKSGMEELVRTQFLKDFEKRSFAIPQEFLINHICGSFVEMVRWWMEGRCRQTPEELDEYFRAVIDPIL